MKGRIIAFKPSLKISFALFACARALACPRAIARAGGNSRVRLCTRRLLADAFDTGLSGSGYIK
jgi:hypothetical protein